MMREQIAKLEAWCGRALGFDPIRHLDEETVLLRDIETAVADVDFFRTKRFGSAAELGAYRVLLYCLIRLMRPTVFVETGVLHGLTTVFLLQALSDNDHGTLVSIDLPSYFEDGPANQDGFDDTLPPGLQPGWVVPQRLQGRWDLRLGSSRDLLPVVARESAGKTAIFLHDSDHTMDNMLWEFQCAWNGFDGLQVLVSDNVDFNTSFFDFALRVGEPPCAFADSSGPLRFAMLKKG